MIAVIVPCYRDCEIVPTLLNLFETCSQPQNLRVFVCLQIDETVEKDAKILSDLKNLQKVDQIYIFGRSSQNADGPMSARFHCFQLLHNKVQISELEYIYLIDCHMRFCQKWDVQLIQDLNKCPQPLKSIISSYPGTYYLPNWIMYDNRPKLIKPSGTDSDGMIRLCANTLEKYPSIPIESPAICAGNTFSSAQILKDLPYFGYTLNLPHLFFGEEVFISARLFTHGYKFYCGTRNVSYHLWERTTRTHPVIDFEIRKQSQTKLMQLLNTDTRNREYFGQERELADFLQTISVSVSVKDIQH